MYATQKNIFLYWDLGENHLPLIHQMNVNNIKNRLRRTGWNIVVTSLLKNSKCYIGNLIDLPSYFFDMKNKIKNLSDIPANQSDIIRLRLLERYGGVYFDVSTILLKNSIEEIELYNILMQTKQANLAGYTNFTFTRKNQDGTNYFKDGKDGLELGILYAKRGSKLLNILNNELDKYWLCKTKNKNYKEYPLFLKHNLKDVSFLNEYHIHYTLFHMVLTRDKTLSENLVTQSTHMKGKENSERDGPYSISDRFCRDSTGYGSANPKQLLKVFLKGNVKMFNSITTTLDSRVEMFLQEDLFSIPGYLRVEIEKCFKNKDDYMNIESAYRYFYNLIK